MKTLILAGTALALATTVSAQWTEITPTTSPSGRTTHGMATNLLTGNVVLYGGDTLGFPSGASNETWSYDGSDWMNLTPSGGVPAATGIELVYDSNRAVFVTYGSLNTSFFGGASVDRTWDYTPASNSWAENLTLTSTPGGLGLYGMAFDSTPGFNNVVLYGGIANNFFPIDSDITWEYHSGGANWRQVTTTGTPGPLERPGMCFHEVAGVTVLFGGIDVQVGGTDETWLYTSNNDGTGTWVTAAVTGPRPSVRTGCKMAYDTARQICVMTGGQDPTNGTPFDDTWEFDLANLTWTQVPSTYTNARLNAGLAYVLQRRQMVMFGGVNFQTFAAYGDTWEYGARSETFGTGCAGSNGVPALDAVDAPRFGQNLTLTATNLNPTVNTMVLVLSLSDIAPLALGGFGMPGCTGYVGPDVLLTATGAAGGASSNIAMPTSLALMGSTIFSQALSFDPNINPLWLAASNAHKGTLGN